MSKKTRRRLERTMQVRAISIENGLEVIEQVKLVRIKSKKYNVLIMVDSQPMLGEVEGDVTIVNSDGEKKYSQIKGYYVNKENVLSLIVEGELDAGISK
ncbi:MAG: hypothetical protein R3Y58_10660 [Eubacteriales bacterium]